MLDRSAAPRLVVPNAVRVAIALAGLYVVLGVIELVLTLSLEEQLVSSWAAGTPGQKAAIAGEAAPAFVAVAITRLAVTLAIIGWTVVYLRRGANWARLVAVAFSALGLVRAVYTVLQHQPVLFVVGNIVDGLVLVVLVGCLFLPSANRFFSRRP